MTSVLAVGTPEGRRFRVPEDSSVIGPGNVVIARLDGPDCRQWPMRAVECTRNWVLLMLRRCGWSRAVPSSAGARTPSANAGKIPDPGWCFYCDPWPWLASDAACSS